jgi:hypothetical protein
VRLYLFKSVRKIDKFKRLPNSCRFINVSSNATLKGGDNGNDKFQVHGGSDPAEDMPDYVVNR